MDYFNRLISRTVKLLTTAGIVTFLSMMLLIVANVLLRAFNKPIMGTHEAVSILMVFTVAFALGYCALLQNHIVIAIVIDHVHPSIRKIFAIITAILSGFIWVLIAWQSAVFGLEQWRLKEATIIMGWPNYPFRLLFAFGLFIFCIILIKDIVYQFRNNIKEGDKLN